MAFAAALDKSVQFRALTFQEFFGKLSGSLRAEDAAYAAYLSARYFGGGAA